MAGKITRAEFLKELLPGLNALFGSEYEPIYTVSIRGIVYVKEMGEKRRRIDWEDPVV